MNNINTWTFNKYKSFLLHNFWAGLSTISKALTQLFILKMATIHLGTTGLGIVGQALSCALIFQNLTSGGILNYTITSLSHNSDSNELKKKILGTVTLWSLITTIMFLILAFSIAKPISEYVFLNPNYSWFFVGLAGISFSFSLLMLANGILSSNKDIQSLFYSNLTTLIVSTLVFYILVDHYGITGALIGVLTFYFIQGFIYLFFAFKKNYLVIKELIPLKNIHQIKVMTGYLILIAVSGVLNNLYLVSIRSYLIGNLGFNWSDLGLWQSVIKISDVALSFIAVSIMTSYFPAISQVKDKSVIKQVIKDHSKKIIPLIIFICVFIAIFAPYILSNVYSTDFIKATTLLRYQMVGDVFKFSTSLFTYFFIARTKIYVLIAYEFICVTILSVFSIYFVSHYSLIGLIYGHIISSILALTIAFIFYKLLQSSRFNRFLKK